MTGQQTEWTEGEQEFGVGRVYETPLGEVQRFAQPTHRTMIDGSVLRGWGIKERGARGWHGGFASKREALAELSAPACGSAGHPVLMRQARDT